MTCYSYAMKNKTFKQLCEKIFRKKDPKYGDIVNKYIEIKKEMDKYKKGFDILMEYFDSISDEEKPKVDKQLKEIGL